jgi:hypothetical protein
MKISRRTDFGTETAILDGIPKELEAQLQDVIRGSGFVRQGTGNLDSSGGHEATSLVERVSAASVKEIDHALADLQSMRVTLLEHNEQIRMQLAAYEEANEKAAVSVSQVSEILMQWREITSASRQPEAAE